MTAVSMPDDWSREEVEVTVADYFAMLDQELRGQAYNKAAHRRRLGPLLSNRSDAAIERKHQNTSAILIRLGFVYIAGYKPLGNFQRLLFDVVSDRLARSRDLTDLVAQQVSAPAEVPPVEDILHAAVDPPGTGRPHQPYGLHQVFEGWTSQHQGVDYLAREAANRSLGAAGEEFVLRFERARLLAAGRTGLADQVERVSLSRGDGAGFDVLSFEVSGQERWIEVKTTAYGSSTPFYVTRNEVTVSREKAEQYHLYRAFDFRQRPRLFQKRGPLEQSFLLAPSQFIARLL